MVNINCASCSIDFAISDPFYQRRKKDGECFYCPAGHLNLFPIKMSEDQITIVRLKNEIEILTSKLNVKTEVIDHPLTQVLKEQEKS